MIDIAIPKGSLLNQTLQLEQAGLEVRRTEREYNARVNDHVNKVKILRPQEIPAYVAKGYFDLGISGTDWIMESGAVVATVCELNYGKLGPGIVKLVVATPESQDVHSAKDIKPGSRVATEYPNLTRSFFQGRYTRRFSSLTGNRGQGAGAYRCGSGPNRDRLNS
jgi:ATP phosphoribosyltransferase